MQVAVEYDSDAITVKINGLLHAFVDRHRLVAITSWINGQGWYFIAYHMEGAPTPITCEYDNEEKWIAILSQMNGLTKRLGRSAS